MRTRLIVAFSILCVVAVFSVFFVVTAAIRVGQSQSTVVKRHARGMQLLQQVSSEASHTNVLLQHGLGTDDTDANLIREVTWNRRILPGLDSLNGLSRHWPDSLDRNTLRQLTAKLKALHKLQGELVATSGSLETGVLTEGVPVSGSAAGLGPEGLALAQETNELARALSYSLNGTMNVAGGSEAWEFDKFRLMLLLLALGLVVLSTVLYRFINP